MGLMSNSDNDESDVNDKLYREVMKIEIVNKVTEKINNGDLTVLKTIKTLLDEDDDIEQADNPEKKLKKPE